MSRRSTPEAFIVTVALHIAAIAILLVVGFLAEWIEEDPPVIMQLVDLSGDMPLSRTTNETPAPPESLPEEPAPTLEELEALEIPEFEDLAPAPEIPEPEPEPEPPPPPPRKISFSEHLQEHGEPEVTPRRQRPRPPAPTPELKTDFRDDLTKNLSRPKLTTSAASLSTAQASELEAYVAGIQRQLQAVFRPVGPPGLRATVAFTVAPYGVFTNYRIARSSGNAAFDAAALEAFRKIGRYRPTPDRRSYEWEIIFRSVL